MLLGIAARIVFRLLFLNLSQASDKLQSWHADLSYVQKRYKYFDTHLNPGNFL